MKNEAIQWFKEVHIDNEPMERKLYLSSVYFNILSYDELLKSQDFFEIARVNDICYDLLELSQKELGMFHSTTKTLNDSWYRISHVLFETSRKERKKLSKSLHDIATL